VWLGAANTLIFDKVLSSGSTTDWHPPKSGGSGGMINR